MGEQGWYMGGEEHVVLGQGEAERDPAARQRGGGAGGVDFWRGRRSLRQGHEGEVLQWRSVARHGSRQAEMRLRLPRRRELLRVFYGAGGQLPELRSRGRYVQRHIVAPRDPRLCFSGELEDQWQMEESARREVRVGGTGFGGEAKMQRSAADCKLCRRVFEGLRYSDST